MRVFCGIDWAEDHHDVALVDAEGNLVAKRRIGDDAAGFATVLQLLAAAGDSSQRPIPVAIETGDLSGARTRLWRLTSGFKPLPRTR